ncbi:MAG: hypothetical protein K6E87_06590 [bacterium]|nr:hypothetical protein [bacterium]
MYEEKDEEGISLLDLFKVAFGRKILLLIITLSITLVGILFVKFYYNQNKRQYYVNYEYVIPGIEEGKYIDDSKFNYQMLISPNSLNKVKESNEEFKNINIEKLVDKDGIQVTCDITRNETTNEVTDMKFKLVANVKYFKNGSQANKFIHAVADQPYNKTLLLLDTIKYDSLLDTYKNSNVYDTKADCLVKQYELLQAQYEKLIEKYGDVSLSDGKKLSAYYNELTIYFTENNVEALVTELQKNGYVKDFTSYEAELLNQKQKYESDLQLNQNKINNLVDVANSFNSNITAPDLAAYNEIIAKLAVENAEFERKLEAINKQLENGSSDPDYETKKKAFDTKIEKYDEVLTNFTNDFKIVVKEVVTEGSYVSYNNNTVKVQGGIKLLIAGPALLILGCFVGCIVNICLDHKKLGKKEEQKETVENN